MSGLTDQGFEVKTFAEIVASLEQNYIAAFGDINLEGDSLVGEEIRIDSTALTELWSAAESIYNAQFIDTSTGISLDYICSSIGVRRLEATPTKATTIVTTTNNTTLLQNIEARASASEVVFRSDRAKTISNNNCIISTVTVESDTQASYTITLNGTPYEYVPFIIDQIPQIIDGLLLAINSASNGFTAVEDGLEGIRVASDDQSEFIIGVSTDIRISSVSNFLDFTSTELGDTPLPANTLTTIVTPLVGWISINNPTAGNTGRNIETDNELRARYKQSLRLPGSGSVEALRANLRNVPGVIVADVTDNKTLNTVGGLPPKSFNCIVLGGDDQDIANVIWTRKPAGIQDFGEVQVIIQDSEGFDQAIFFSRPTPVYIYVRVSLTLDSTNTYPVNGDELISQGVLDIIRLLNVGEDVIYQAFFRAVYAVEGIESATIEIGGTLNEFVIPSLSSSNISIAASESAVSDLTKIEVLVV